MNRPRFSVSSLLVIVAVIACLLAALLHASPLWTTLVATLTFLLLISGVAGACFARGLERAFWSGFALFGITYLVLVNWDWIGGQFGHDLTPDLSDLAAVVFPEPEGPAAPPLPVGARLPVYLEPSQATRVRAIRVGNFTEMSRLVLSLGVALAGGMVSRRFAARAVANADDRDRTP
jgi:hypothetical protein